MKIKGDNIWKVFCTMRGKLISTHLMIVSLLYKHESHLGKTEPPCHLQEKIIFCFYVKWKRQGVKVKRKNKANEIACTKAQRLFTVKGFDYTVLYNLNTLLSHGNISN